MTSPNQQDTIFVNQEADAWFERNAEFATTPISSEHRVLQALKRITLPQQGVLLDVGGASGKVAAGFQREYPEWRCCVVEPSGKAIATGRVAFPQIEFCQGSITQPEGLPWTGVDVVIVSGVFCWVDRSLLSRAVCNIDLALKDSGFLLISDFDSPFLRASENLVGHSFSDPTDAYDRQWVTTVLKKDLQGRYFRQEQ